MIRYNQQHVDARNRDTSETRKKHMGERSESDKRSLELAFRSWDVNDITVSSNISRYITDIFWWQNPVIPWENSAIIEGWITGTPHWFLQSWPKTDLQAMASFEDLSTTTRTDFPRQKSVEFQIFRLLLLLPTKLTFAQRPGREGTWGNWVPFQKRKITQVLLFQLFKPVLKSLSSSDSSQLKFYLQLFTFWHVFRHFTCHFTWHAIWYFLRHSIYSAKQLRLPDTFSVWHRIWHMI